MSVSGVAGGYVDECAQARVPVSLLWDAHLTAAQKVAWAGIAARADMAPRRRLCCSRLASYCGLCRLTVARALEQLRARGWLSPEGHAVVPTASVVAGPAAKLPDLGCTEVPVPIEVLRDKDLGAQARVAFMQLQATRVGTGALMDKFAPLGVHLRKCARATRRVIGELAEKGWVIAEQANRVSPVALRLRNGRTEAFEEMWSWAMRHLERAESKFEAMMQIILLLNVDSDEGVNNARLDCLKNPKTGEVMHFDRYYPAQKLAFEGNGSQHYEAFGRFSEEDVAAQRERDEAKLRIAAERGIEVIVIRTHELSRRDIVSKLPPKLPRRDLLGARRFTDWIDKFCADYQAKVALGEVSTPG